MHIELVDTLRCPHPHEDTWLVASVTRFDGREVVEGTLGCPACRRQFPVRGGEVDFTAGDGSGAGGEPPAAIPPAEGRDHGRASGEASGEASDEASGEAPDDEASDEASDEGTFLRARALLALAEPGGIVLLGGVHARHAEAFEDEGQVMTLLLNASHPPGGWGRPPSAMRAADGVPVASGALRAAWLDRTTATPGILAAVARGLRRGGRLVAPADASLPAGVRELARDAGEWVAEGEGGVSAPVALRRR